MIIKTMKQKRELFSLLNQFENKCLQQKSPFGSFFIRKMRLKAAISERKEGDTTHLFWRREDRNCLGLFVKLHRGTMVTDCM